MARKHRTWEHWMWANFCRKKEKEWVQGPWRNFLLRWTSFYLVSHISQILETQRLSGKFIFCDLLKFSEWTFLIVGMAVSVAGGKTKMALRKAFLKKEERRNVSAKKRKTGHVRGRTGGWGKEDGCHFAIDIWGLERCFVLFGVCPRNFALHLGIETMGLMGENRDQNLDLFQLFPMPSMIYLTYWDCDLHLGFPDTGSLVVVAVGSKFGWKINCWSGLEVLEKFFFSINFIFLGRWVLDFFVLH